MPNSRLKTSSSARELVNTQSGSFSGDGTLRKSSTPVRLGKCTSRKIRLGVGAVANSPRLHKNSTAR
jgi:hypothetical protein